MSSVIMNKQTTNNQSFNYDKKNVEKIIWKQEQHDENGIGVNVSAYVRILSILQRECVYIFL